MESGTEPQNQELNEVLNIINALARKSASADYIYRGETQCFDEVSSRLFREYPYVTDIEDVQQVHLDEARRHTFETDAFDILAELQHYGGDTNLIDFTTDYLIALFFACDGDYSLNGRVVLLKKTEERNKQIYSPRHPVKRVLAQKSVFVWTPDGYVEPDACQKIPHHLKLPMLDYLQKAHGISTETIYNDLHGFIRVQTIHREANKKLAMALVQLEREDYQGAIEWCDKALDLNPRMTEAYFERGNVYRNRGELDQAIGDYNRAIELDAEYAAAYHERGNAYHDKGELDQAIGDYNRAIELDAEYAAAYNSRGVAYYNKGEYDRAITDYTKVIELIPEYDIAYSNLGEAWMHLSDWEKARENLRVAQEMGADIVASFRNDYENVADFEQQTGLTLPDDIAELLGG